MAIHKRLNVKQTTHTYLYRFVFVEIAAAYFLWIFYSYILIGLVCLVLLDLICDNRDKKMGMKKNTTEYFMTCVLSCCYCHVFLFSFYNFKTISYSKDIFLCYAKWQQQYFLRYCYLFQFLLLIYFFVFFCTFTLSFLIWKVCMHVDLLTFEQSSRDIEKKRKRRRRRAKAYRTYVSLFFLTSVYIIRTWKGMQLQAKQKWFKQKSDGWPIKEAKHKL